MSGHTGRSSTCKQSLAVKMEGWEKLLCFDLVLLISDGVVVNDREPFTFNKISGASDGT